MKNFLAIALFIFLAIIAGELIFFIYLNRLNPQRAPAEVKYPLAYTNQELQSSDGFIEMLKRAKENDFSLDSLTGYCKGAFSVRRNMVQSYIISVTAKGIVKKIVNSNGRLAITISDSQNPSDEIAFIYKPDFLSKIEMLPKTLKITDLKEGDILTITDSVDMKTHQTVKAVIAK